MLNPFKLPTPKELGKANCSALPIKSISKPGDYCWEDYYNEVKKLHPIKYFVSRTLPSFLRFKIWYKIAVPTSKVYWYVLHNTIYRYHLLNLSQPKDHIDNYQYGWLDRSEAMLYANFNILREFLEKERPDIIEGDFLVPETYPIDAVWNKANSEMRDLYFWWIDDRQEKLRTLHNMQNELYDNRRRNKKSKTLDKKLQKFENDLEKETEQNLIRLIKLRNFMWS